MRGSCLPSTEPRSRRVQLAMLKNGNEQPRWHVRPMCKRSIVEPRSLLGVGIADLYDCSVTSEVFGTALFSRQRWSLPREWSCRRVVQQRPVLSKTLPLRVKRRQVSPVRSGWTNKPCASPPLSTGARSAACAALFPARGTASRARSVGVAILMEGGSSAKTTHNFRC